MQKQSYFSRHNTILSYAWSFFKVNKDLLWLPIVNMILVSLIYLCLILVPPLVAWKHISLTSIALMLLLLLMTMILLKAVFRGALYACVVSRLQAKPMTVMEGVAKVLECLPSLFIYTLFDSIIGNLCSFFEDSHDIISDIIFTLINASWKLATLFCIPLILFEKKGPLSSIKSSVDFCKTTIRLQYRSGMRLFSYVSCLVLPIIALAVLTLVLLGQGLIIDYAQSHPLVVMLDILFLCAVLSLLCQMIEVVAVSSVYLVLRNTAQDDGVAPSIPGREVDGLISSVLYSS